VPEQRAPRAKQGGRASAPVVVNLRYASTLKRSEQAETIIQEIVEHTEVPL
jgi:hypothetical protein